MNIFQINKLSKLHDGIKIIFCKTDFLGAEFDYIRKLKSEVVLISGNSDYAISDQTMSFLPPNVKKWFAQNALANHPRLEPLPIGYENRFFCERDGHGIGYPERVWIKENLCEFTQIKPDKEIYCNFNISTNPRHRNAVLHYCNRAGFMTIKQANLSLEEFYNDVFEHRMSVCPIGNGIDTHRLWEVLSCGRVPITVKAGDFKIYELYEKLPIIILNSIEDLTNKELIYEEYDKQLLKMDVAKQMVDTDYWINQVLMACDD